MEEGFRFELVPGPNIQPNSDRFPYCRKTYRQRHNQGGPLTQGHVVLMNQTSYNMYFPGRYWTVVQIVSKN